MDTNEQNQEQNGASAASVTTKEAPYQGGSTPTPEPDGPTAISVLKGTEEDTAAEDEFVSLVNGKTLGEVNDLLKAGIAAGQPRKRSKLFDWVESIAVKPFEGMDTAKAQDAIHAHKAETQPPARM